MPTATTTMQQLRVVNEDNIIVWERCMTDPIPALQGWLDAMDWDDHNVQVLVTFDRLSLRVIEYERTIVTNIDANGAQWDKPAGGLRWLDERPIYDVVDVTFKP